MESINLSEIEISPDRTYHIYKGKPLYKRRFIYVMSFHPPGVAAVIDESGAYHINLEGKPIYDRRFIKTYGYYEGIATVIDEKGYTHIDLKGRYIHDKHFAWAGNFQYGRCPVRDWDGKYYHIKQNGEPAYKERYAYVGDYYHDIAVVYDSDGYAYHIDKYGNPVHNKKFLELYPYHKDIAVARDENGYFHIDRKGNPLYNIRFRYVENYYNDYALAWDWNGRMLIIDKKGNIVHEVTRYSSKSVKSNARKKLMDMMIGYWYTQIIYAVAKLNILDLIKNGNNTIEELKEQLRMEEQCIRLIIDFLRVYGFINKSPNGHYNITELGLLLTENYPDTLKYAALLWGDEHYKTMSFLVTALKECNEVFSKIYDKDYYKYLRENKEKMNIFIKSMKTYSRDYDSLIPLMDIPRDVHTIIDLGGGHGELLKKIMNNYPFITKGILMDLPEVIDLVKETLPNDIVGLSGDLLDNIPLRNLDAAILARVLHDWPDRVVPRILCNTNKILKKKGILYIFEILYPKEPQYDLGVSLNFNLLVMLGSRERTLDEYEELLNKSGFTIEKVIPGNIISLIISTKIKDCM